MKQLKITFKGLAKRQPLVSVGNQWVYSISDIITTVFVKFHFFLEFTSFRMGTDNKAEKETENAPSSLNQSNHANRYITINYAKTLIQ